MTMDAAPTPIGPPQPPAFARGLYRTLTTTEVVICYVSFIIGTVALALDIFGREFLGFGIFGAQRLAVYCMAVAGVLGFSYVISHGGHLRPTLLDRVLPRHMDRTVTRLGDLVSCGLCLMLTWGAFLFVKSTWQIGERDMTLPMLIWPVQSVLVVTFVFAALKYLLFAIWPVLRPAPGGGEL